MKHCSGASNSICSLTLLLIKSKINLYKNNKFRTLIYDLCALWQVSVTDNLALDFRVWRLMVFSGLFFWEPLEWPMQHIYSSYPIAWLQRFRSGRCFSNTLDQSNEDYIPLRVLISSKITTRTSQKNTVVQIRIVLF